MTRTPERTPRIPDSVQAAGLLAALFLVCLAVTILDAVISHG